MKRLKLLQWSGSVLTLRTRPKHTYSLTPYTRCSRCQSTAAVPVSAPLEDPRIRIASASFTENILLSLPSPPATVAKTSAKLSALHARLSLPIGLPVETLARTLVDSSADPSPRFNNHSFSILGNDLLSYYTSEYIICQYPRLPLAVVFAAMWAYVGETALTAITREWGVEAAAAPGGEVDAGVLQFKRAPPEARPERSDIQLVSTMPEGNSVRRRGMSSRTVYDDQFGELIPRPDTEQHQAEGVTLQKASTTFVRGVMGAVYIHAGRSAAKQFYRDHFMSRQLNMADLFNFRMPTRDLSRLCAREGFRSPVARILSETGRKSRHPVFVVGVFSGADKLGEGAGSSLDEARTRASVAALKGWYLYSPLECRVPSETEEPGSRPWKSVVVDSGDIVV